MLEQSLSPKEYFLWTKNVEKHYPWERQYLNLEFLEYEKKRISEAMNWCRKVKRAGIGCNLDEISLYVLPLELYSSWKAAIAESGNFGYTGLSTLSNNPQASIVGLIPPTVKHPQEYRLILIRKSKGRIIFNERLNRAEHMIEIEEWEYLDSDYIYRDVPFEKKILSKILSENLGGNELIASSFQSPLIGAPHDGALGGISLSSIAGDSSFARELVKTIQLIVPPEYRTLQPPKSAYRGIKFHHAQGIDFHFAERPYPSSNLISGFCPNKYNIVDRELMKRRRFSGEYSIFSTMNSEEGGTAAWKELLVNFTNTEITLPENLDDLVEADVYLKRFRGIINEDLWIQIVFSRQYKPTIGIQMENAFIDTVRSLRKDFDVLLSDIHRQDEDREYQVQCLLGPSKYNLGRIAQSFARADEKREVDAYYLKKARNLLIDNFTGFIEHPEFERERWKMEANRANARFKIVQTEIINNPYSSSIEIFNRVKFSGLFKDIYDLQDLLDWMKKKGHVFENQNKRYVWV